MGFKRLEQRLKTATKSRRNMQRKLSQLRQEQEDSTTIIDNTPVMEDDLVDRKQQLRSQEEKLAEAGRALSDKSASLSNLEAKKKKINQTSKQLVKEAEDMEEELGRIMEEKIQRARGVERARESMTASEEKVATKEQELEQTQASLEKAHDDAVKYTRLELGPEAQVPIKVETSKAYVKARINKLTEKQKRGLAQKKGDLRDLDKCRMKLLAVQKAYAEKESFLKVTQENMKLLKADLQERVTRWKKLRKHISNETNKFFDQYLQSNGKSGMLEINHREQTMGVTVCMNNQDTQTQSENTAQFSGGERSSVTVALLLSLGECIESPFRIMDEFDVFMDAVSRKTAIDNLIGHGKRLSHRQFIFITPQDISGVKADGDMVRTLEMPTHQIAGQSTLD